MLAALAIGELWYRIGQEKTYLAIAYGFCEVLPDRVTVLARIAERAEDIDPARAEEARKRAQARLQQMKDIDFERARMALEKALARLQTSSRLPAGRVGRQRMPPPQA
jgi:F-type H+-transporting ATPase subunit epsilon